MPILTKEQLKAYFENGLVPRYEEYVDLIDTMGDMNKSVYDPNDDGKVNSAVNADNATNATNATNAGNADTLDGMHSNAFAPSGFGLGVSAEDVSNRDMNTIYTTGFYRGQNCTNTPLGTGWHYYIVIQHSSTYCVQIATYYFTNNLPRTYIRRNVNGTWDNWFAIWPAAWADITGIPSSFPPSSHGHVPSDISGDPLATSVYRNTNLSLGNASVVTVSMSGEHYDPNNMWSSGYSSRIYSQSNGIYLLNVHGTFDNNSNGWRQIRFRLNGSTYLQIHQIPALSGATTTITMTMGWYIYSGQYVEIQVYQNSGSTINLQNMEFQMAKLI